MKIFWLKSIFLVVVQVIPFGCGQARTSTESIKPEAAATDKNPGADAADEIQTSQQSGLSLDSFVEMPPDIEGCSCFFSESEEKYNRQEYVFVADFDSTAFISVNNKMIALKLVSLGRDSLAFGDYDRVDIYKRDSYKVTVEMKYHDLPQAEGDEVWSNSGSVTIENGEG